MTSKNLPIGFTFLLILSLTASVNLIGQKKWGLGVRLGDPAGVSIKKYVYVNAWELSIGRTHWLDRNDWYNDRFVDWYWDQKFNYTEFRYAGYDVTAPVALQFHYLFHKEINRIGNESVNGLDWYFGFGGQLRYQAYYYDFYYKLVGSNEWYYAKSKKVTDIDLGADGVIGLEYLFNDVPISIFLDLSLFMEIVDNPFVFCWQGGIGARYNF